MNHAKKSPTAWFFAALLVLAAICAFISPVSAQGGGSAEYVVKGGDTLTRIANQYGLTLEKLIAANPVVEDPGRLTVGQVIILPPGRSEGILPQRPKRMFWWELEQEGVRVQQSDHLYLVRSGDNYLRVTRRFGITVDDFYAANPQLSYLAFLSRGELVHIPIDKLGERAYQFYVSPESP